MMPGSSSSGAGSAGSTKGGVRGSSGRLTTSAMDEESTAGRGAGGRTASGMRSGGRGPVAADRLGRAHRRLHGRGT